LGYRGRRLSLYDHKLFELSTLSLYCICLAFLDLIMKLKLLLRLVALAEVFVRYAQPIMSLR